MSLKDSDVTSIARLARLSVERDSIPALVDELSTILDFVAQMDRVDTADVEPLAHPLELSARARPDEVTETNRRDDFQATAPLVEDGVYLVPKVIE